MINVFEFVVSTSAAIVLMTILLSAYIHWIYR
jgi:cbb3-type cytochrome oxidase subunit 3